MQEGAATIGSPPIPLVLRVSKRARRLSLRVSSLDGRVTLTRPAWVKVEDALDFAATREDWLRMQLGRQEDPVQMVHGVRLPFEGRMATLEVAEGRRVHLADDVLFAPRHGTGAAVEAFLKARARDRGSAAVERYARVLGRSASRLSFRDTRSRWGSCTTKGGIMLSWRLILAPPEILDYVAAHEVAHLQHMDHSPAFWAQVEALYPDHKRASAWLREHGPGLHRYRFRD